MLNVKETVPVFLRAVFEVNTFSQRGGVGGEAVSVLLHECRCYLVNTQLSSYKHKQNPVERLAPGPF